MSRARAASNRSTAASGSPLYDADGRFRQLSGAFSSVERGILLDAMCTQGESRRRMWIARWHRRQRQTRHAADEWLTCSCVCPCSCRRCAAPGTPAPPSASLAAPASSGAGASAGTGVAGGAGVGAGDASALCSSASSAAIARSSCPMPCTAVKKNHHDKNPRYDEWKHPATLQTLPEHRLHRIHRVFLLLNQSICLRRLPAVES
eukprot:SAG25_NODE_3376_length_1106_cov_1.512413_1_plen_204_part_10